MIVVIGGGPAGFFGAIQAKVNAPNKTVTLFEKSEKLLHKVSISGGGRCNVTNICHVPADLVKNYPRGGRALIGPFSRFSPLETEAWFTEHGVPLKAEADGRMFPATNTSQTVVDCLVNTAVELGIKIHTGTTVNRIDTQPDGSFELDLSHGNNLNCSQILLAAGGRTSVGKTGTDGYSLAASLGHSIEQPVPSLFTFKIADPLLNDMAGVSVQNAAAKISCPGMPKKGLSQTGPVLITHWGLSGPAVLRLSAWGARELFKANYQAQLIVNWCPDQSREQIDQLLREKTEKQGSKQIGTQALFNLPRRLWLALVDQAEIETNLKWASLAKKRRLRLVEGICATTLTVSGKGAFKDEFVTCGGIKLNEVDTRTMQSKVCPGLFLAGEILDIDGITGGFNFQAAWTTGWIAGNALALA